MGEPRQLDVVAAVVSPDDVTSPFSGDRAAFFHVELVAIDPVGTESPIGELVLGDVVVFRGLAEPLEVAIVVRRATMRLVGVRSGATPLDRLARVPPEAIPLLARANGRGTPCFREHAVRCGTRVRLRATVDYSASPRAVVRDDLGAVTIDELLDGGG